MLTGAHKTRRLPLTLNILRLYHKHGDEVLNRIVRVTGDETWVSFVNVETEEQSKQWMHTHSSNKPKKFNQALSACQKADCNCFLGQERNADGETRASRDHSNVRNVLPFKTKSTEC
jgi:exosome complex RNA-binding protein Csl4